MANEINLTSQKWNDIIFEGKNKDYGAYEIRRTSGRRHVIALIIIAAIVVFITFLPQLIDTLTPVRNISDNRSDSSVLADLKQLEDQVKEKDIIREVAAPPPPILKQTIQFVEPEIVTKEEMVDEDELKTQDELASSKGQISVATVEGVEKGGVDIQDLEGQKVIIEDEDMVHDFVEQMPSFPGGEKALNRFLSKNIRYPEMAASSRIQGRVVIQFVVGKDGAVSEINVIGKVDRSLDAEASRVVKSMPKWIPGRQNGQAVSVRFVLPVVFQLGD